MTQTHPHTSAYTSAHTHMDEINIFKETDPKTWKKIFSQTYLYHGEGPLKNVQTRRANAQAIHTCHACKISLQSSPLHYQSLWKFWPFHATLQKNDCISSSLCITVTLNEGQSHSCQQNAEFNHVCYHTKFKTNQVISIQTQANLKHILHKLTGVLFLHYSSRNNN